MTTFSVSRRGRTRWLVLALAALLAFGLSGSLAVGASAQGTAAGEAQTSAAAKKGKAKAKAKGKTKAKRKKCPKGQKLVGGKCKKPKVKVKPKKAPSKSSAIVQSIRLTRIGESGFYRTTLHGTLTLKKPVPSIRVTVVRARGTYETDREETITTDGTSLTVDFEVTARHPPRRERTNDPIVYWVVADGIMSNVLQ